MLHAIAVYRTQSTKAPDKTLTPYMRRQRADALADLERAGVLLESEETDELEPLPLEGEGAGRITVPAEFDYGSVSLAALKTMLACFRFARYSRRPFQFTTTQAELAKSAGLSERSVRDALRELERRYVIEQEKVWQKGTKITLCEPNAGVPLFYLGEYQRRRLNVVPIADRYRYFLAPYDPKQKLGDVESAVTNYKVFCPFCKSHKGREPSLKFTSTDEGDYWICYNCRRSGNSERLWAKMDNWRESTDWRTIMAGAESPDWISEAAHSASGMEVTA